MSGRRAMDSPPRRWRGGAVRPSRWLAPEAVREHGGIDEAIEGPMSARDKGTVAHRASGL